jgi:hypothetical protein
MKSRKTHKGGRFYGKGTYGHVMGAPRLPCPDETMEGIQHNREVSKVLHREADYMNEHSVMNRLAEAMKPADIELLREYIVLPIKGCKLDIDQIKAHDVYKSDDWFKDNHGKKVETFKYEADGYYIKDEMKNDIFQVVYPIGTQSFESRREQLLSTNHPNNIYTLFFELGDLFKALKVIQKMDFIHMDIKAANAIVIGGKVKFIDLERLTKCTMDPFHGRNFRQMVDNIQFINHYPLYYPWSQDTVLLQIMESRRYNDIMYMNELYKKLFSEKSYGMALELFDEFSYLFYNLRKNKFGFSVEETERLLNMFMAVVVERFYGLTGLNNISTRLTIDNFDIREIKQSYYLLTQRIMDERYADAAGTSILPPSPKIARAKDDYHKFIQRINIRVPSYLTEEQYNGVHDYIFKKNDIHSMGVILMNFINRIKFPVRDPIFNEVMYNIHVLTTICMLSNIPHDFGRYYHERNMYFKHIYDSYAHTLNFISSHINPQHRAVNVPLPESSSSSRSRRSRGTPRSSAKISHKNKSRGSTRWRTTRKTPT